MEELLSLVVKRQDEILYRMTKIRRIMMIITILLIGIAVVLVALVSRL